jgi:hypothetical protein
MGNRDYFCGFGKNSRERSREGGETPMAADSRDFPMRGWSPKESYSRAQEEKREIEAYKKPL